MARIPYPDLAQASASLTETVGAQPLNIVRMMAHAEKPALALLQLGGALLSGTELDPKLRELVILRISALSRSAYEVRQHEQHARNAGVPSGKIDAAAEGADHPIFDHREKAALRLTDDMFARPKADAALLEAVSRFLSPRAIVELIMTIGFYMMICRMLETLEIDIEEAD